MTSSEKKLLARWSRLGIMFGVAPAARTPDIERLLIETAGMLGRNARLLPAVVTWLVKFEILVIRHRLARLADETPRSDTFAALGLMLEFARRHTRTDHFNTVIARCTPASEAKCLFEVDRRSLAMAKLAKDQSCALARRWGLWAQEPELKTDAVRPTNWVMSHNPDLHYRAVFAGNLRASILTCIKAHPAAGHSESALACACGVTRKALRDALDHLQFCGLVSRERTGWRNIIKLAGALAGRK